MVYMRMTFQPSNYGSSRMIWCIEFPLDFGSLEQP
jgi:hypothetical protein